MSATDTALSRPGPRDLAGETEPLPEPQRRCVCFRVGAEWFALPIQRVREIQPLPHVVRVPHAPPDILGIVNLRGRVLTLLASEAPLGLPPADAPSHCLVLDLGEADPYVGLAIHGAGEVLGVPLSAIQPPPPRAQAPGGLEGVFEAGHRAVGLIDLARLYGRRLAEWGIELPPVASR
ncbi:MAG: chemotaxis protein CheW [Candidatus Methylomirabilales bacterium]